VEIDAACARSLRLAGARRRAAARRRIALRALLVAVVACVAFAARPAPVEPMAGHAPRPARAAESAGSVCLIPARFVSAFRAASAQAGVRLSLLSAVAWEESRMNPDALSAAGAEGLLQVLPATAATVVMEGHGLRANVLAGARYLRQMLDRFGDLELALAAYNAGPTAVDAAGGAPTLATLRYAKNVEARAASLSGCA
jgi:soluble lytic murein transglycosylase-like protein